MIGRKVCEKRHIVGVSMVEFNLSRGRKDLDYRWIACRMQVCVNMTGTLLKVRVDIYSVSAFTSALEKC